MKSYEIWEKINGQEYDEYENKINEKLKSNSNYILIGLGQAQII